MQLSMSNRKGLTETYLADQEMQLNPQDSFEGNATDTAKLSGDPPRGSGVWQTEMPAMPANRMLVKFHLVNRFKILEKIHFSKISTFSGQKNPFSKRNFEKLKLFYNNFLNFRKTI